MPRSLSTVVSLAVLSLATGLLTASPAQAATGTITGLAGKCLDVAGANSADGTAVQLYDCNGTAAQQWTVGSDGTVRALGKCLASPMTGESGSTSARTVGAM
ncbi:ricin-type beta-trefoil lectin domain protein, partial [Streptomyces umbrinus]